MNMNTPDIAFHLLQTVSI